MVVTIILTLDNIFVGITTNGVKNYINRSIDYRFLNYKTSSDITTVLLDINL